MIVNVFGPAVVFTQTVPKSARLVAVNIVPLLAGVTDAQVFPTKMASTCCVGALAAVP